MSRKIHFVAVIAAIGLLGTLTACSETSSDHLDPQAETQTSPEQSESQTDLNGDDLAQELGFGNLDKLRNIADPEDEAGKVSFPKYKDGIAAVLFSDTEDVSSADNAILQAYSQCLAAKTYPHVSAKYAELIASKDFERLATEEPADIDGTIFDHGLRECFLLEQED